MASLWMSVGTTAFFSIWANIAALLFSSGYTLGKRWTGYNTFVHANVIRYFNGLEVELDGIFWYDVRRYVHLSSMGHVEDEAFGWYREIFPFNNYPTYVNLMSDWYIWWDGVNTWYITEDIGILGKKYWKKTDSISPWGTYGPQGEAKYEVPICGLKKPPPYYD
jgi:hypothetical protein